MVWTATSGVAGTVIRKIAFKYIINFLLRGFMSSRLSIGKMIRSCYLLLMSFLLYISTFGYVTNMVNFAKCDFETPCNAEIWCGVGIIIPPIGIVEGLISIRNGKK